MRVSGKITHSFYCFLQARGFDLSRLFELTSLEMEFVKDPAQWMDISYVESFLKNLEREYSKTFPNFLQQVGHFCFELGAWGELDSVLKMRKADLVFSQVPVFLSYFISDPFSLLNDRDEKGILGFKCNLSLEEYPCVTEYLQAVLESLPLYSGEPRSEVKWIRNYIQIKWEHENKQTALFSVSSATNIKPELLNDFKKFLEKIEKELYIQRQEIIKKNKEIRNLKDQLLMHGLALPEDISIVIQKIEKNLLEIKGDVFFPENNFSKMSKSHLDLLSTNLIQLREILNIKP